VREILASRIAPPVALLDRAIVKLLPAVPKPVVQRISSRYIAGSTLDDAVRVVRELNADGKLATVDVLGEEIHDAGETAAFVRAYEDVLEAIERERLDSNISIKLTALGLKVDYELCRRNLVEVVGHAAARDTFVRIDMEDSSTTTDTLRLYRELREAGRDNLGVVLQAYMRRTVADIRDLADLRPNVRLCKGIYVEPPEIAFRDFDAVRANFVKALDELLGAGAYVGVATHDEWLIGQALERVAGMAPDEYEFQMLLGVRERRADELVAAGHRLRVYTPFGREWYGYSLRRLQENPKVAGYIAGDTLGRLLGR
jgi:proline dehydrogenase